MDRMAGCLAGDRRAKTSRSANVPKAKEQFWEDLEGRPDARKKAIGLRRSDAPDQMWGSDAGNPNKLGKHRDCPTTTLTTLTTLTALSPTAAPDCTVPLSELLSTGQAQIWAIILAYLAHLCYRTMNSVIWPL